MYPQKNAPNGLLLSEVAGAVGHSVNNLTAYLFSAADQLDASAEIDDLIAIQRAVGAACRAATSLGAALHLLALDRTDCEKLMKFGQAISDKALAECIAAAAADRASIDRFDEWPGGVVLATADTDTIKATFLCAIAYLGKQGGESAAMTYSTYLAVQPEGRTCRICINLNSHCEKTQHKTRRSHCPFDLALRNLPAVEDALGVRVLSPEKGCLRIEVDARIIDPVHA